MIKTVTAVHLFCDGCGIRLDPPEGVKEYRSSLDARIAAAQVGWTFPPTINSASKSTSRHTSDVCPGCLYDWEPVVRQTSHHGRS
jgi:hypothetical protein